MKGRDPKQAGIEVTEKVKHWRNCLQKNEMTKPRGWNMYRHDECG